MVDLHNVLGLGVAGNIAGHMKQAGEVKEVSKIKQETPTGIFPFYVKNYPNFLHTFPFSSTEIRLPNKQADVQIEPELGILCEVDYKYQKVNTLSPKYFMAFNDCSIRTPPTEKLSQRKNWGSASKGIAENWISLDKFNKYGNLHEYFILCYLRRNGILHTYGINTSVVNYSYFYQKLLNWLVASINEQQDKGLFEEIKQYIKANKNPSQLLVAIGGTQYSEYGKKTYLKKGDEIFVILYDSSLIKPSTIKKIISKPKFRPTENISILYQKVNCR